MKIHIYAQGHCEAPLKDFLNFRATLQVGEVREVEEVVVIRLQLQSDGLLLNLCQASDLASPPTLLRGTTDHPSRAGRQEQVWRRVLPFCQPSLSLGLGAR